MRTNVKDEFKIKFKYRTEINDTLKITFSVPRLTTNQTNRCNIPTENKEDIIDMLFFIPWLD